MGTGEGLVIRELCKAYGERQVLHDLDLAVRPGELFGFVGSNGAGKTTTMRIVLGVLAADAGEVLLDGAPVTAASRRRIGYMPEERGLYPKMPVGEQLVYLARLHGMTRAEATDAMERWTERLGVAARRADMVDSLSLGNQQRVQLAAALVHDPAVLVLDEPFSGLDPVAVDVMSEVLREKVAQGVPTVFSSHQLDLVERLCDRVGIIRDGRMVVNGSVEDLRSGSGGVLRVDAPQAGEGWAAGVPGVDSVSRRAGVWAVTLAPGADEQPVLAAALATGPVHEFARHRPPLSDIYRDVVTAEEVPA